MSAIGELLHDLRQPAKQPPHHTQQQPAHGHDHDERQHAGRDKEHETPTGCCEPPSFSAAAGTRDVARKAGASFLFSLGPDHTGRAITRVFRAGFLRKEGGVFRWGTKPEPWTFHFDT